MGSLLAGAADASVIFEFRQTSAVPASTEMQMTSRITLSDSAFVSGVSLSATEINQQVDWSAIGIEGLFFSTSPGMGQLEASLADLVPGPGPDEPATLITWTLTVQSDPGQIPDIYFTFNDQRSAFYWTLGAAGAHVGFDTDAPTECFLTGTCHFYGEFVRVPEPSAIGLLILGAGLLWRISAMRRPSRIATGASAS